MLLVKKFVQRNPLTTPGDVPMRRCGIFIILVLENPLKIEIKN